MKKLLSLLALCFLASSIPTFAQDTFTTYRVISWAVEYTGSNTVETYQFSITETDTYYARIERKNLYVFGWDGQEWAITLALTNARALFVDERSNLLIFTGITNDRKYRTVLTVAKQKF